MKAPLPPAALKLIKGAAPVTEVFIPSDAAPGLLDALAPPVPMVIVITCPGVTVS